MYKWNQYDNLIYPVSPDYGISAWLIKLVVAVDKGEIGTNGAESKKAQNGGGGARWPETTLNLGDCRAPHRQRLSSEEKKILS